MIWWDHGRWDGGHESGRGWRRGVWRWGEGLSGEMAEAWGVKQAELNPFHIWDILEASFLCLDSPDLRAPCQPKTAPCPQANWPRWTWGTEARSYASLGPSPHSHPTQSGPGLSSGLRGILFPDTKSGISPWCGIILVGRGRNPLSRNLASPGERVNACVAQLGVNTSVSSVQFLQESGGPCPAWVCDSVVYVRTQPGLSEEM